LIKHRDLICFTSIYAVAFAIVLWYGLTHLPVNDGVWEYADYMNNIQQGGWKFRLSSVNSCLVTTYLPALVYKITGGDTLFIFRLIPALFYPLMPAFTYLIARRYVTVRNAVIASLVVLCSSYFIFFPDIGRVGVSMAFMAGMIWALLSKRMAWSIIFAVLLVFSHYATSFIAVGIVGLTWIVYLIWQRKSLKQYLIVFIVLLLLTLVWHFGVARYSGDWMFSTLFQTKQAGALPVYDSLDKLVPVLLDPASREPAVQEALFLNANQMTVPQFIEILSNYLMVIMVSFGLFLTLRRKDIDRQFKIMALSFYGLIIFTVAIPWLSVYYNGMRVYYNSTILLAVCFPIGVEKLSKFIKTPMLAVSGFILIMYALSTSGLIYNLFGLHKYLPVVLELTR
jgi:uncharacterized membrane protein